MKFKASALRVWSVLTGSHARLRNERTPSPPPPSWELPSTPTHKYDNPAIFNTPVARNENSAQTLGFDPDNAKDRYSRLIDDAKPTVVGPMPVNQFLDSFLPEQDSVDYRRGMLSSKDAFAMVPEGAEHETNIYDPLIAALNKTDGLRSRCPGFEFLDTSTRVEYHNKPGSMKPDICCYTNTHAQIIRVPGTISKARTQMGYAALFFELKNRAQLDFFSDPPAGLTVTERRSWQFVLKEDEYNQTDFRYAQEAFGQNVAYATEICARQHRCFCFSVSLAGSYARLIRWDRAGAIVTEPFDIRGYPEHLCEFLWRFSQVSDKERGYDMTVQMATPAEEAIFKQKISDHVAQQLGPLLDKGITNDVDLSGEVKEMARKAALEDAVLEHYKSSVVTAITMFVKGSDGYYQHRRILISRPVKSPLSLASRGTRAYWAFDTVLCQVVFLKDTWRYDVDRMSPEGEVLSTLNEVGVRFVPKLLYHGDVCCEACDGSNEGIQYTRTHEFINEDWVCGKDLRVVKHAHYRLVEGTVGYGLRRFAGTKELLTVTYDVFQAMLDAYRKDQRIHRDVSLDNIILYRDSGGVRRGILVDWELSCRPQFKGEPRDYWRTATWQFMSVRTLTNQKVPHSLQDDMESILYVVLYCSLRWLPHNLSVTDLLYTIKEFFEHYGSLSGQDLGGFGKGLNMTTRTLTQNIRFANPVLHRWLNTVMDYCSPIQDQMSRPGSNHGSKWDDPMHLDAFWNKLLKTHTLADDDRVEYDLPNPPRDSAVDPYEPTIPSHSLGKRKEREMLEGPGLEDDKIDDDTVMDGHREIAPGVRRSQRLRKKRTMTLPAVVEDAGTQQQPIRARGMPKDQKSRAGGTKTRGRVKKRGRY